MKQATPKGCKGAYPMGVGDFSSALTTVKNQGFDESKVQFKKSIDPNGLHSERRWGEEFPKAVEWLFFS